MRISKLKLRNFRACRMTEVEFADDLTVLVGENASGKSALIDALRLITFPASGRQSLWFSAPRDLSSNVNLGEPVEIQVRFTDLNHSERALYLPVLIDSHDELVYTGTFATAPDVAQRNVLTWSIGDSLADDPEPSLKRRISHVYLPPLRDAVRDLDGGDQNQLYEVLRIIIGSDEEKHEEFVATTNDALAVVSKHAVARETQTTIQDYFTRSTPPRRHHNVGLGQRDVDLRRIARLLRIQLTENDIPLGDIASSGLGYANLLYMAMIVLQLAKAKESDLTLLLVEEPEAHLHPQLQLVLLDFLKEQAAASGKKTESLEPAGKVQVVVTTHSPTLSSTVSIRQVVVVARDDGRENWGTKSTSLWQLGLTEKEVRQLDRYLTVTRSSLLFAREVLLVGGIAEMLVMPAIASYLFTSGQMASAATPLSRESAESAESIGHHNGAIIPPQETASGSVGADTLVQRRLRQFRSATIISVDGVDFEPYLTLLLQGAHPRVDRVVVVTDRDHTRAGDVRKSRYESRFESDVAAGRLSVLVGGTTLEAELFRYPGNEPLLRNAFLELHPHSQHRWLKVVEAANCRTPTERAEIFAGAIRKSSDKRDGLELDISKGEFAHLVADALAEKGFSGLSVPEYLRVAIDTLSSISESN